MESLLRYLDYFFLNVLLSEIARANGGNGISEGVITVPFHFSDEQKTAMRSVNQSGNLARPIQSHFFLLVSYLVSQLIIRLINN